MAIEIRGIPVDRALRARVVAQLTSAVGLVGKQPVTAQATFFDENGPKGGLAMRCAITARLPYRSHVRVEDTAETLRAAFDGAIAKLEREIAQYRSRDRESRRHPKKYYVAKRIMTGEGAGSGAAPERKSGRRGSARRRA